MDVVVSADQLFPLLSCCWSLRDQRDDAAVVIVVIDRPAMSLTWDAQKRRSVYKAPELPATKRIDLSGAETIKELFERLEGVDVPRRVGAPEPTAAAAPRRAQIQAAVQNRRATIAGSPSAHPRSATSQVCR